MKKKLINFFKKPQSRHIGINTLGNYLNIFFTAAFALILVRVLTPSQYGVLSVLLGIAYTLSNVCDFGTTAVIYSSLPPLIEQSKNQEINKSAVYRFIKSTFFYQSLFSSIAVFILLLIFPYLDNFFFKTNSPYWTLYLTALSILFFIWQNFVINLSFAAKKFFKANLYLNLANIFKMLFILFLAVIKSLSVGSIIFIFGILGPLIFFIFFLLEKKDLAMAVFKSDIKKGELRTKYTLTFFLASQFYNLGLRTDLFLLAFFRPKAEVGYYGLSQKIILTIITTAVSITQVLSPSFAKIKTKKEISHQVKTAFFYLLLPGGLLILTFVIPGQVFEFFFTQKFAGSTAITKLLALSHILYVIRIIPMLFILYTVKKPGFILIADILFFLTVAAGCLRLIPILGVFGPPIALAFGFLLEFIILIIASIFEYKKLS